MIAAARITSVGSNPIVAVLVAVIVVLIGRRVARSVAKKEHNPALLNLLTWSLALHLLCAPAEIFIVDHIYHGVADYNRFVFQGTNLANNIRAGHFTFAGTGITKILNDGLVSIYSSIVLTVIGPNKLGEFLVFALLSFVGDVCFYRAFSITFPGANKRRYAYMVFFLPSLLFWTADASKEAVMTLALGIAALGVARVLAREKNGYLFILIGSAIGIGVRPHELALLLVGFAIAMFFRGRDPNLKGRLSRRIFSILFLLIVLGGSAYVTEKLLGSTSLSTITAKVNTDNSGTGAGFGSSNLSYSSNPLYYPKDVYAVLFDPLPINARTGSQLLAAGENTLILVLILTSLRQLRLVFRVARWKPYIIVCLLYSLAFLYVFAALGNLGLIERERVLFLPFFLALLAIPVSPKGGRRIYPWERARQKRRDRGQHAGSSRRTTAAL